MGHNDDLTEGTEKREEFIRKLPKLKEKDIADPGKHVGHALWLYERLTTTNVQDDACPICQETFLSVIALEEMASVIDSPGMPEEELGVTKLSCGHKFCRKE